MFFDLESYSEVALCTTILVALVAIILFNCQRTTKMPNSGGGSEHKKTQDKETPVSVNYHITRHCNYACKFCFHRDTSSFVLPIEEAKRGLQMLRDAGLKKINFAGGEPFIVNRGNFVGKCVQFCKDDLGIGIVTIVSNGSLISPKWFQKYGKWLDILAISCDSFNPETLRKIGRGAPRKDHLKQLLKIRELCRRHNVAFKINTVCCETNKTENLTEHIQSLDPVRWKIYQCLLIKGENAELEEARKMTITSEEFKAFVARHSSLNHIIAAESNDVMRNSYLILDEYMRFLDNSNGFKTPSASILDVGVKSAMSKSGFDRKMFFKRGGKYVWSKKDMNLDW